MMNQELFSKFKIISFAASGLLILWYFFDVNISKIQFIKDLGLKNQQIISYILVFLIIFCTAESILEFSKSNNKSWQSKVQLLFLIMLPLSSLIIAYPKVAANSILQDTKRFDLVIPFLSSLFTAFWASQLIFDLKTTVVFYKFRKKILPVQMAMIAFSSALIILGIISLNLFNENKTFVTFSTRYSIFTVSFILFFITISPRGEIFSQKKLDWLAKKSASLDRQVETSEYVASLKKPITKPKKKIHKKIMKTIKRVDEEERKGIFPRFIMLKELSFKEDGAHLVPDVKNIDDNEPVLRVNIIQKENGNILKTEDVKFKYVKMACQQLPKLTPGNDIRTFLTPMASKAYSIQSFHENDPNDLMLNLSASDENLLTLKELFKKRNPDINYVASNGWSALLISVANGEEKTAKFLLQKAADPSIATKHGATPLHFAAKYGKWSLCKLLLDYQADVNQRDIDGSTALMVAARFGHNAIVKLLIQYGADSSLFDDKQKTALTYATEGNYGEICKYLKKNEIEPTKN